MDGLILKGDGRDALKIEVIDDTALIDITAYSCADNKKPETGGKRDKVGRRRGKALKKVCESVFPHTHMVQLAKKRVYSRKEMEALRFVNVEHQKKKWNEIYHGLGPAVAREYDAMLEFNHNHNHLRVDFDPRQNFRKRPVAPAFLGEESSGKMDNEIESMNPSNLACGLSVSDVVDEECSQDDDSDAELSRIQRPAFLVTGVPDFDSGPPQDGLEYLRRVRWEAERIPKVKVAKVERSKLNKEQTIYMPNIPDIAKCSEHLMPLKQWEDSFLADFSELRLTCSRHEGDCAKISGEAQSVSIVHPEECYHGILEKIENLTVDSLSTENENENEDSSSSLSSAVSFVNRPTLSTILGMDSVARVSMLRKRINSVETVSSLSRNDCEWLFALCAAVDTPLNADTCAALRCLLRKCASLRAERSELDDEVVMLNVLATISGKYFGQSES